MEHLGIDSSAIPIGLNIEYVFVPHPQCFNIATVSFPHAQRQGLVMRSYIMAVPPGFDPRYDGKDGISDPDCENYAYEKKFD